MLVTGGAARSNGASLAACGAQRSEWVGEGLLAARNGKQQSRPGAADAGLLIAVGAEVMLMLFRKSIAPPPPQRIESISDLLAWCGAGRRSETFVRDGVRKPPPQVSASDHLYFAARLVAADGRQQVMQYAFVDDRGNVAFSAFVRSTSPVMMYGGAASEDLLVEPISDALFGELAVRLCAGATLVGFHRVLQAGMLPDQAVAGAAGAECAWRRFQAVARQRGIGLSRREPLTLNDCLEKLGLAPLESEDAALRALAIRALWRKLDGVD